MTDNQWHKWEGGHMPVPEGTMVQVIHRDGEWYTCRAGEDYAEDWEHDSECPEDGDIMAYRVMQ